MTAEAEYIGGVSLGQAIPLAVAAVAAGQATVTATLPSAQARFAGALQAAAAVTISPPSIEAAATLAAAAAASVAAAITGPTVGASAGVAAQVVAEVGAELGALEIQAALFAQLLATLGTAGFHMYLVEGDVGQMGNALQARLSGGAPGGSGPTQIGTGVYIFANDNGAVAALRACFGL